MNHYIEKYKEEIIKAIEKGKNSISFKNGKSFIDVEMQYDDFSESTKINNGYEYEPTRIRITDIRNIIVTAYVTEEEEFDNIYKREID